MIRCAVWRQILWGTETDRLLQKPQVEYLKNRDGIDLKNTVHVQPMLDFFRAQGKFFPEEVKEKWKKRRQKLIGMFFAFLRNKTLQNMKTLRNFTLR